MTKKHTQSMQLGGRTLTLETGSWARQATCAVKATWGDTVLLAVLTVGREKPELDYFPLQVEYVEKLYAGGIIKGSRWVKREGKPTDESILKGRLIDRSVRPLFPKSYRKEVQIVIHLMSLDKDASPEVLGAIAASAAIHASSVPWNGPIATNKVAYIDNELIVNPSESLMEKSTLELIATTVGNKINMIETKATLLGEDIIEAALKLSREASLPVIEFINQFKVAVGMPKDVVAESPFATDLLDILNNDFAQDLATMIQNKASRENADPAELETFAAKVAEKYPEKFEPKTVVQATDYLVKKLIKEYILENKKRLDGRALDQVRELTAEVAVLPRVHGSAVFGRGDTQVITIATLGSPGMSQLLEGPDGQDTKRYIHHYNFPSYSVGEVGRIGFTNRREIGHGALAEKAIEPVIPSVEEFPYTMRLVSETLGSNGSTSMASTCASSLALMDAGVPIREAIGGIAMGLVSKSDTDYLVLTDIMGVEDFSGEMDFKIAGGKSGITAIQLDVKNMGLTEQMITEILAKGKVARLHVLDVMNASIASNRQSVSSLAPKIQIITVPEEKIGEIIGPGGKNIRALMKQFTVTIDVEDDGKVAISGEDAAQVDLCTKYIANMTRDILPGEKFEGVVSRVENYGAFVEVAPGKTGLLHVSRLSDGYIGNVADVVKVGQKIEVEVFEIDEMGRINIKPVTLFKGQERPAHPEGGHAPREGFAGRPHTGHGGRGGGRSHGGSRGGFGHGGGGHGGRGFGGRH